MSRRGQKRTDAPPPHDALDAAIAEILEEKPWLSSAEIGKRVNLHRHTVDKRRAGERFRTYYSWRNPPSKAWIEDLKPALRKRLAMIAASLNDAVALKLGQQVLSEELGAAPPEQQLGLGAPTRAALRAYFGARDGETG